MKNWNNGSVITKNIILFLILFFILLINTLYGLTPCKKGPFKVKNAYYQSWLISEEEKGTDVGLILTKPDEGLTFDSIVFRGVRLEVFETRQKKKIHLKSILPSGKSRLSLNYKVVNLPDQLIYRHHGERKIILLKPLLRKKTRYY